ncbi:MAG TPA: ferredoxin [Aeromicrobium sp.]|nr:ferredoxin [Aeromicrobium sp.]HKY57368.1 ferredoxin [Aeromicrobium sp.]
MARKVVADWDLCEANGICEAMAPDAFHVDDDDLLQILVDVVTPENEDRMQRAVAGCPKSALSIVEVDE